MGTPGLGLDIGRMQCPKCNSEHVNRQRRMRADRWKYAAVYECDDCQHRITVSYLKRPPVLTLPHFLRGPWITFHARCPECGSLQLTVQAERDYIEGFRINPLRVMQRLLRAPMYYCADCRLQFNDLRPRMKLQD